jgi:hypothetical protein
MAKEKKPDERIGMKMPPELKKAFEKMHPGSVTKDGFLGEDARPLPLIISDQHAACLRRQVSHQRIGDAMRRIGRAGLAGFGGPITVGDKWEVVADENRGKMPCPWPEPGVYQKTVYTVKNLRSGKSVRYSELSIHLVEKHCFFQGVGAPYHNDPEALIDILELEPGLDHPAVPNLP